ncbi:MAG: hypothetical protein DMF41_06015 [Verrucomicrobia bacterium]|nr:MAG: hypothetical protein DMF41_06015 [Verrucomicrobiota bacterium]
MSRLIRGVYPVNNESNAKTHHTPTPKAFASKSTACKIHADAIPFCGSFGSAPVLASLLVVYSHLFIAPYLILLRFKLGESFFSPDNIGFLSAAELKEFLLAAYVCFCGFELGALTFRRRDLRSFS